MSTDTNKDRFNRDDQNDVNRDSEKTEHSSRDKSGDTSEQDTDMNLEEDDAL